MRISSIFLTLLLLFLVNFVHASGTSTGTSTVGTQTDIPKIISCNIIPYNIVMNAGDSITVFAESVDETGTVTEYQDGFNSNIGNVSHNLFTSSKAGKGVISIICGGVIASTEVTVLPAEPQHITITALKTLEYGKKYQSENLFQYQVFDKFDNDIPIASSSIKSIIKKNTIGNLLGRLISSGESFNSPYVAILRPVLVGGYIVENGQVLFFERGTYTITVQYGNIIGTKEFTVEFAEPYKNIEAWKDYNMGELSLDNRFITITYGIGDEPILKIVPLTGDIYDNFYSNGLMCKLYAICYGHYEILRIRQDMIEANSKKAINKAFLMLIAPKTEAK